MEEQETNYSWTIDGEKIFSQTPPINCKNWKVLVSTVLTPIVMDLDISKISAKLSRLILCKAGEKYDFKSPAMIKSGKSPSNVNIGETCSNITEVECFFLK